MTGHEPQPQTPAPEQRRRADRRRAWPGVWVALGFVLTAGCAPADGGSESTAGRPPETGLNPDRAAGIRDSVRVALDEFAAAGGRGDWDAVAAYYSDKPGFVWLEDGGVSYSSVAEITESLASVTATLTRAQLVWIEPNIVALAPGRAAVATRFEQTFLSTEGQEFSFSGVISAVMIHESRGGASYRATLRQAGRILSSSAHD